MAIAPKKLAMHLIMRQAFNQDYMLRATGFAYRHIV